MVPPLVRPKVPPIVIVPELVIGPPVKVKPVESPETSTLVTVPEVGDIHLRPLVCVESALNTWPFVPTPSLILFVASRVRISPLVVSGDKALKPVIAVVCPVPPLAIGTAPLNVLVPKLRVKPAPVAPDVRVPVPVIFPCTADGKVELIDGTPAPLVIKIPLFAVVIFERVSAAVVKRMVFVPPKVVRPVPPAATPSVPNVIGLPTPPPESNGCPLVPAVVGKLKL